MLWQVLALESTICIAKDTEKRDDFQKLVFKFQRGYLTLIEHFRCHGKALVCSSLYLESLELQERGTMCPKHYLNNKVNTDRKYSLCHSNMKNSQRLCVFLLLEKHLSQQNQSEELYTRAQILFCHQKERLKKKSQKSNANLILLQAREC